MATTTAAPRPTDQRTSLRAALILILIFTLAQGAFRAWIVPPWQNFDEPGHVEVLLYIAEHGPVYSDQSLDLALRQRISDAYRGTDCDADIVGSTTGCLGFHQFQEPPLYYWYQAIFQALFRPQSIIAALQLARVASTLLHLLIVLAGFATLRIIEPERVFPALAVAGLLAVLPGLAGMMATVNNDVMAAACGSLLVLAATALTVRGISLPRLIALIAACGLTALSKPTAALLIPIALLSLWLALRLPARWLLLPLLIGGLLAVPLAFDLRSAAAWTSTAGDIDDRQPETSAPQGRYVFSLGEAERLRYSFAAETLNGLRGERLLLRASGRGDHGYVWIHDGRSEAEITFEVDDWQSENRVFTVAPDAPFLIVEMVGVRGQSQFDALSLQVERGGPELLRNGSAERGTPLLREAVNRRLPLGINMRLERLQAWWYSWPITLATVRDLFLSFWGSYAWGASTFQLPFTGLLALITLLAAAGLGREGWRALRGQTEASQWKALLLFALIALGCFAITFIRSDPYEVDGGFPFISSARYFYPAILPAMGLLFAGWRSCFLGRERLAQGAIGLLIAVLFTMHVLATFSTQLPYFASLN